MKKFYFHQTIVEFLCRYFPNLFDRYLGDYSVAIVHKIRREVHKEHKKLEEYFELCEFTSDGCDCDKCGKNPPNERLWFERTSFETIEGNYYCDKCALEIVRELENYKPDSKCCASFIKKDKTK